MCLALCLLYYLINLHITYILDATIGPRKRLPTTYRLLSPTLFCRKSTGSGGRQTWMKQPWVTIKSYVMSISLGFLILKLGVKIVRTLGS